MDDNRKLALKKHLIFAGKVSFSIASVIFLFVFWLYMGLVNGGITNIFAWLIFIVWFSVYYKTCLKGVWDGTYLRPVGWQRTNDLTKHTGGFVKFNDKAIIEFNDEGEVTKGVLNKKTKLLSPAGITIYEEGTTVEFADNGFVVKATKE